MQAEDNISIRYGSTRIVRIFFPVYFFIVKWVRSSPLLTRWLYRARQPPGKRVSWDFTTLVLRKALIPRAMPGKSILEIGVGNGALLCIFLAKKFGVIPDGVDVAPERVQSAKQVAGFNNFDLDIRQSDLFESVDRKYDIVFFNSVYIPTGFGEIHELARRRQYDDTRGWDGGSDGTETIARFLDQAPDVLNAKGELLLGVNNFYLPDSAMLGLINEHGWKLVERVGMKANPSVVYVLLREGREDGF